MELSAGDVCWVDFGHRIGSEPDKRRPAVVLQADWLSRLGTVALVPVHSNMELRRHPTTVVLRRATSGLDADGVVMCHAVTAVDRATIDGVAGKVDDRTLATIRLHVAEVLGIDAETFLAG